MALMADMPAMPRVGFTTRTAAGIASSPHGAAPSKLLTQVASSMIEPAFANGPPQRAKQALPNMGRLAPKDVGAPLRLKTVQLIGKFNVVVSASRSSGLTN